METAFYIQEVLREELKQSTVITIAHRVEAVKDADYKIVLDKGRVVAAGPL
jgi:ABC-type multidrug transport system fused ATPase/permease subunit